MNRQELLTQITTLDRDARAAIRTARQAMRTYRATMRKLERRAAVLDRAMDRLAPQPSIMLDHRFDNVVHRIESGLDLVLDIEPND